MKPLSLWRASLLASSSIPLALLMLTGVQSPVWSQSQEPKPAAQNQPNASQPKEEIKGPQRYEQEIAALEKTAKPLPPGTILFVGSSMIRLWKLDQSFPNQKMVNFGFGGSKTSDVNYFFDRMILAYRPERIVFYGGDNDLASGDAPEVIAMRVDAFLTRVEKELPGTKVAVLAIKPSPNRIKFLEAQSYTNSLLEFICALHPSSQFVDTFTPVLAGGLRPKADLFDKDQLHFNEAGYAVWAKTLTPVLTQSNFALSTTPTVAQPLRQYRILRSIPGAPQRRRILPWRNP